MMREEVISKVQGKEGRGKKERRKGKKRREKKLKQMEGFLAYFDTQQLSKKL